MDKIKEGLKKIKQNICSSKLNLAIFISCIIVITLSVWLLVLLLTRKDGVDDALQIVEMTASSATRENPSETETQTETAGQTTQAGKLQAEIKKSNEWSGNGEYFMQYDINLTNITEEDLSDWELRITFNSDVKVSQGWGGNFTSEGNELMIQPVDYTKDIPAGEVRNLGVIISSGETQEIRVDSYAVRLSGFEEEVKVSQEETTGETVRENMQETTEESVTQGVAERNLESAQAQNYQSAAVTSGYVSEHGKLRVNGTNIVDQNGAVFQIRGVSTHGLSWFGEYVNKESFQSLKNMGANTVRLAMYTNEYGGYCSGGDREILKNLIHQGVSYATELGMYVIIDWHILSDGNPKTYESEAVEFFSEMAGTYASYQNVLYEICNEPNGGTDWDTIRDYAEDVISAIRAKDSEAIVIVGTPNWSQDVDAASKNPVSGYENIVYALHFYAATHKDDLRGKLQTAVQNGLPLLVSEFSICDASGNGGIDYDSASAWINLLDANGIGYVAWNLSNKQETSSLLSASCSKTGNFTTDDLSETGKWYSALLQSKNPAQ